MMVVSLKSTDDTKPPSSLSVIFSVMSVGDFIFHTATVPSCRHKNTHHSNDNDEHRCIVESTTSQFETELYCYRASETYMFQLCDIRDLNRV